MLKVRPLASPRTLRCRLTSPALICIGWIGPCVLMIAELETRYRTVFASALILPVIWTYFLYLNKGHRSRKGSRAQSAATLASQARPPASVRPSSVPHEGDSMTRSGLFDSPSSPTSDPDGSG